MDSDDTQQPAVSEPVGQQLKRAREQKGLSVSAVADAQHLRPAVIHAIEDGNYQQIDSELFLKGYVRAFARQVELDPDAVIATLDKELEPLRQQKAQAEELNPLVDIERRRRQKRRIAKLLFLVLFIVIAVFVALRFLDTSGFTSTPDEPDNSGATPGVTEPAESEPEINDSPVIDSGIDDRDVKDSGADNSGLDESPDVTETAPVDTGLVDEDSTVAQANEAVSVPETPAPTPTDGQGEFPPVAERESDDVSASRVPVVTSAPEPAFEESAQPDAAAGSARLEMTFIDECWVQVTDSAGNRLVGSLQRDGDRVEVSGRAPIEVIVGAVDAIESIRFDGEPVDMSGFRVVNNRAEFTLDI